jgi:hypothetical protein
MPEMLCHRHLGGIDLPRSRGPYCAISGIKGNTVASIAMTASRYCRQISCRHYAGLEHVERIEVAQFAVGWTVA